MERVGLVVGEEENDLARVQFRRHSLCEKCGQCRGQDEVTQEVKNPIGAEEGDWVLVKVEDRSLVGASLTLYLLPLLALVLGYYVGFSLGGSETWGIGGGFFFMGLFYLMLRLRDKTLEKEEFIPIIKRFALDKEIEESKG